MHTADSGNVVNRKTAFQTTITPVNVSNLVNFEPQNAKKGPKF